MKRLFPILAIFCSACSLAPEYHKPAVAVPEQFGKTSFTHAIPADGLPKGEWWKIYSDRTLDALEDSLPENQDLKAALERLRQAQSALQAQRAMLFPSMDLSGTSQKFNTSRSRANYFRGIPYRYSDNLLTADVSWEPDVFGRISNQVAYSRNQFEAAKADLMALRLTLQAELAADYFSLKALRKQQQLQQELVKSGGEYLELEKALLEGGGAPEADVDQAEISLQNEKSAEREIALNEETLEHAIALLLGRPASGFHVETGDAESTPMAIASLPSRLLERRPDISSAERQVEAANAEIGVARAAYFPNFTLNAVGGFESGQLGNIFATPSELWALGAGAAVNVFDAGLRKALTEEARARYEETVANYRQIVLNAYREVEDSLSSLDQLESENASQKAAVESASKAAKQAEFRYRGGMANYQDMVLSNMQLLQAREQLALLDGRRMNASVLLVKALGGSPE